MRSHGVRVFFGMIVVCGAISFWLPSPCCASTVLLRSGKLLEGEIIETTDEYIRLNYKDMKLYYCWEDIASLDGCPVEKNRKYNGAGPAARIDNGQPTVGAPPQPDFYAGSAEMSEAVVQDRNQPEQLRQENKQLREQVTLLKSALKKLQVAYNINLGGAYAYAQLFDQAIEAYQIALILEPDTPDPLFNLGLIHEYHLGDMQAAANYYKRYLELKPDAQEKEKLQAVIAQYCRPP